MKICSIENCRNKHKAKGLCSKHYQKLWKYGSPDIDKRSVAGKCSVSGCERKHYANGYCFAHYQRSRKGADLSSPIRKTIKRSHGEKTIDKNGYVRIAGERKYEHILIAEKAIGKPLPIGAQVHHIDGDKSNNNRSNLVICKDIAYHQLLHRRQRAMDECGDPNKIKCTICKKWDHKYNMSSQNRHSECRRKYEANRRLK